MMGRTSRILVLVLPIAGLAALWGWSDYRSRQGTDWLVPVAGYDPRDLLRGHYVEFTYDWPGEIDENDMFQPQFCIEGTPPTVERVVFTDDLAQCAYPARASGSDIYGFEGLLRGRLYIAQTRSRELEEKLRDPDLRGIVRVRQREDGLITPLEITFRPLTAEERAAREQPRETAAPPPIVITPAN
ncbi:MAG: hypothetical protein A3J40_04265 [Erythrobacter sp. RIFCSPHIGHO2_12_FULL_63_10]|nr:MAG: hypothetical protein A3J40_04265 [Erythrobacter sp. RIFCSPHIGHO2_12_FULL_63_10]